ncbi:MAG: hypothetical protein HOH43_01835, partial [Candidatus Latescibacteria bacterium]|nr:hypothetical protein [Candidatus Latescibacterota bacterium]
MSDHSYPLVDQSPVFQLYDARDGLVSHTTHLLQDRLGYLWVGTWTGLYLFDGITFELVYANADTTDNYITCLYNDTRDRIWFGSGGPHGAGNGVVCHENGRFTTYTAKDGLACDYILDICEDSAGCLWFGTNNGATSYDGEQFTTYREGEGLTGQNIHLVHRDVHDRMWFSTGQEVFYLNEDDGDVPGNLSFTRWGENWQWDGFTYKDRRDRIWVLHHTGVTCIDGDKHTHLTAADGLIWNNQFIRNRIAEDAQGNLWFLAHGAGISKFDDKRLFSFTVEGRKIGLGMAMLADIDGNIWTNDAGLLRMEPNTVVMIDEGAVLTAFIEDSHSRFWHTNSDSNLLCFVLPSLAKTSKSKVVAYENDHTVPMCMLETSDGHVWVGGGNFLPYKMMRYRSIDVLYSKGIVQSEEISESGDVKDFSDALPYEYYN